MNLKPGQTATILKDGKAHANWKALSTQIEYSPKKYSEPPSVDFKSYLDTYNSDSIPPNYPSPPLRTAFSTKFNNQASFSNNDKSTIPYPAAGTLSPNRRCDMLCDPAINHQPGIPTYMVTTTSVKAIIKGRALCDRGANGGIAGDYMREMDD